MQRINLAEKLETFDELWSPRIIARCNNHEVKIAKVKGEFVWHQHDGEDELFLVLDGTLFIEFEDHTEELHQGELISIPKGVPHKPYTKDDTTVSILLFEPASTQHTGTVESDLTQKQKIFI
ncbi:MAG: cupin domain-containing protein [Saprospiraceae bacterium]|nr:cupin domain-containing protein [Saprospiraceae bacterium]